MRNLVIWLSYQVQQSQRFHDDSSAGQVPSCGDAQSCRSHSHKYALPDVYNIQFYACTLAVTGVNASTRRTLLLHKHSISDDADRHSLDVDVGQGTVQVAYTSAPCYEASEISSLSNPAHPRFCLPTARKKLQLPHLANIFTHLYLSALSSIERLSDLSPTSQVASGCARSSFAPQAAHPLISCHPA
jgi:hypothetical protein